MYSRLSRARRAFSVILGLVTLAGVAALFMWDVRPDLFPAGAHDLLGAFPLAMIAVAYLVYQASHWPGWREWLKAVLLAVAFLLWAANQLWPEARGATLWNDGAIGLFVLDVFLVIVGWPVTSPDESFGETYADARWTGEPAARRCGLDECCSATCRRCGC
jgi:multisubunit Na+/H+ antiporter MnhB subunit